MPFVFLQGGSRISTLAPNTQKGREGTENHAQHCKTQWEISLTTLLRGTVIRLSQRFCVSFLKLWKVQWC